MVIGSEQLPQGHTKKPDMVKRKVGKVLQIFDGVPLHTKGIISCLRWPSLYEAFEDGLINTERLRKIFVKYVLLAHEGKRVVVGIDATPIPRPFSQTSADRTTMPMHNIPHTQIRYPHAQYPKEVDGPDVWLEVFDRDGFARKTKQLGRYFRSKAYFF